MKTGFLDVIPLKSMQRKYCHLCGTKLTDFQERSWWCPHCQQRYYDNPRPTADVALFDEKDRILLVKRALDPGKGKWDVPGGFIEFDEVLEDGALRELQEELGITAKDITNFAYNTNYTALYEWGKETYHILATSFCARIDSKTALHPADDASDYRYYSLDELETVDLSFPMHREVIQAAAKKLGII